MRVRLKGINTVRRRLADGSESIHHYFRATGQKLEGQPGTPEFLQSYAAAERAIRERGRGTLADLIRRFEASPEFADMAETTRTEYVRKFKRIDKRWGSCPIGGLKEAAFRRAVLAWRDELAVTARREADNLVSAIARVLAFSLDRGDVPVNVLAQFRHVYSADRSEMIWLPEHVDAFLRVATAEMRLAMMLALHTGQRQGDLRRLPWSAYDGTRIELRQSKRSALVSIPCTKALKRALDAAERRGVLMLTTSKNRAWTKRYFAQRWQETCEAASISGLHFHDLRGTAATMLAEAGCTVPEIATVTGWSTAHAQRLLDVYLARTRHLADTAILKLERRARGLQNGP